MSHRDPSLYRRDKPRFSDRESKTSGREFVDPHGVNVPVINPSISPMRPRPPKYPDMSWRNPHFRIGVIGSFLFHLIVAFLLFYDASSPRAVLINESKNEPGPISPHVSPTTAQPEIIKAVSVNSEEVNQMVNRLKQQHAEQQQAEKTHQQQLARLAQAAIEQRVQEEKRLKQLKDESEKIAIARKKQLEEQQQHLKQLALQKAQETKRLQAMKHQQEVLKQQQEEAKKLAGLQQKQAAEEARAAKEHAEKERAALAAADAFKRQEAAAHQAQLDSANQARTAGIVDKYKALIIDAISRQWILPENVNQNLSSQFRIRLAPDGGVLEVSLIRSSGDPILDRSAQTAIYKASPLPVPGDPSTFNLFRDISLTVRPENIRG